MSKKKYLCIHCKAQFDEIPPKEKNECIRGYYHDLVKASDIIWASSRSFQTLATKAIEE